ncbi:hypothetical protein [Anaerococcus cruorum]|uniref:hypothetical protein n=1 Tax=Anaerococcus sp. WGS1596 TaxID=3366806 RepID=UPI00372CE827
MEKKDSGYQEYNHLDEIKDESSDRGLEDNKNSEEEKKEETPMPQTKTIEENKEKAAPTQNVNYKKEEKAEPNQDPDMNHSQDMLDESLKENVDEEKTDE